MVVMEFFPSLQLTFFGGWLLLIWIWIIQPLILIVVPKDVRARLLDRSTFNRTQWLLTGISKTIVLLVQIIIIVTPLAIESFEFLIGLTLFTLGMIGEVIAVINFVTTPLDEPVTRGLYRISRNPQETMLSVAIFGACIAVGSWFLFLLFGFSRIFNHVHIIAQEQACLKEYGEAYHDYMKKTPRYFLVF
ncbi:MAG: hypothetical protein JSV04_11910 [Candidatus Heimdallarchaeota archaeon]|nr:MAG: hypothetical protein JSV04_11910 [Candidatus Heimdallarchaeota archaeon]